ncbi:MAG TPA: hypothetical protein P5136_00410 [Methanofastidiosum sp.]|nr:hypothetical protein [Methanofastidiosum sp.]
MIRDYGRESRRAQLIETEQKDSESNPTVSNAIPMSNPVEDLKNKMKQRTEDVSKGQGTFQSSDPNAVQKAEAAKRQQKLWEAYQQQQAQGR